MNIVKRPQTAISRFSVGLVLYYFRNKHKSMKHNVSPKNKRIDNYNLRMPGTYSVNPF